MTATNGLRGVIAAGTATLALLTVACAAGSAHGAGASASAAKVPTRTKTITLSSHRQAEFTLISEKGLYYRFRRNAAVKWSAYRALYRSHQESCGDLEAKTQNGTIAVVGGFGRFCADGEEPSREIAVVTSGDLTTYASNYLSDDFWDRITLSHQGARAEFSNSEIDQSAVREYVTWTKGVGFGKQHLQ